MVRLVILLKLQNSTEKYSIILDTKVLKLLLIGLYDSKAISKRCEHCEGFNEENFNILLSFIKTRCKKIIITPYLLAEVSNFLEKPRDNYEVVMENALENIQKMKMREIFHNMKKLIESNKKCLCKFGFADASMFKILEESREYTMLITTDEDFLYYCYNNSIKVMQFPFSAYQ